MSACLSSKATKKLGGARGVREDEIFSAAHLKDKQHPHNGAGEWRVVALGRKKAGQLPETIRKGEKTEIGAISSQN